MQFTGILCSEWEQSTQIHVASVVCNTEEESPIAHHKILLLSPHSMNAQVTGQDPSLSLGKASSMTQCWELGLV